MFFTITTLWDYSADDKLMIISLFFFLQKIGIVKAQEKINKIFQNVVCWNFYPEWEDKGVGLCSLNQFRPQNSFAVADWKVVIVISNRYVLVLAFESF